MRMINLAALLLSSALLYTCGSGRPNEGAAANQQPAEEEVMLKPAPKFNADSAYAFVKAQVDFGPRVPNTEAHRQTGDYLLAQLKAYGWETIEQSFEAEAYDGTKLQSRNIIGVLNPDAPKRILLAAHWDTRPYNDKEVKDTTTYQPIDGANDGASGVGVLLEIARIIHEAEKKPDVGIDMIFFDSEDYGQPEGSKDSGEPDMWCLGSQHWSENKHWENYAAYYGILLDMVGAKNAQFYQEGYSRQYAPSVNQSVWRVGHKLGYSQYFKFTASPSIIDDHYYVNTLAKIPMIDIVDYDPQQSASFFPDYHHTLKDNMDLIDRNTLKAVGQTVLQVLYNEESVIQ